MTVEEQIKKEYEAGKDSLKNLADKYNVKYSTVRSWKRRRQWKKGGLNGNKKNKY